MVFPVSLSFIQILLYCLHMTSFSSPTVSCQPVQGLSPPLPQQPLGSDCSTYPILIGNKIINGSISFFGARKAPFWLRSFCRCWRCTYVCPVVLHLRASIIIILYHFSLSRNPIFVNGCAWVWNLWADRDLLPSKTGRSWACACRTAQFLEPKRNSDSLLTEGRNTFLPSTNHHCISSKEVRPWHEVEQQHFAVCCGTRRPDILHFSDYVLLIGENPELWWQAGRQETCSQQEPAGTMIGGDPPYWAVPSPVIRLSESSREKLPAEENSEFPPSPLLGWVYSKGGDCWRGVAQQAGRNTEWVACCVWSLSSISRKRGVGGASEGSNGKPRLTSCPSPDGGPDSEWARAHILAFARVKLSTYLFLDTPAGCPLWLLLLWMETLGNLPAGWDRPHCTEKCFSVLFSCYFLLNVDTSFSFVNTKSAQSTVFYSKLTFFSAK